MLLFVSSFFLSNNLTKFNNNNNNKIQEIKSSFKHMRNVFLFYLQKGQKTWEAFNECNYGFCIYKCNETFL